MKTPLRLGGRGAGEQGGNGEWAKAETAGPASATGDDGFFPSAQHGLRLHPHILGLQLGGQPGVRGSGPWPDGEGHRLPGGQSLCLMPRLGTGLLREEAVAASVGFEAVRPTAGLGDTTQAGRCGSQDRAEPREWPWPPPECPQKGESRVETWRGGGKGSRAQRGSWGGGGRRD